MAYVTVADLRGYLKQVEVGAAKDAELQTVIDRAHSILDDALGFEFAGFAAGDQDVRSPLVRSAWLEVPFHDPGTVTDVAMVFGRGRTTETTQAVDDWLEEDDGRVYLDGGWSARTWYRVTADWGYGDAPDSIVEVELQLAINLWRGKDRGMYSDVIGVEGGGAVGYQRSLTNLQRMIVDDVRRRYLGVVHA
jgi:hypothetical protein